MIRRMSVTFPITGMTVLLILSITFSFYYIQVKALQGIFWGKEITKAEDIYYIVESLIKRDSSKLTALSKALTEHHGLNDGLGYYTSSGGNKVLLKETMDTLFPKLDVDICQVFDQDYHAIYSVTKDGKVKIDFSMTDLQKASDKNNNLIAAKTGKKWALIALDSVVNQDIQTGKLVIGKWIDDDYANKIAYETEVHVSFGTKDGVIASSLPVSNRGKISRKALQESIDDIKSIRMEDAENFKVSHYSPMELAGEIFSVIVEINTKPSYILLEKNKKHILKISFLILVISISLWVGIALYTLRPLKNLKKKAKQTVLDISGEDLKEDKGNEILSLIRCFDKMVETVVNHISERRDAEEALKKHKAELESQVEQRTTELKSANLKLISTIDELEERTKQTQLFNQFGDLIQACDSETETYGLLIKFCKKLFPYDSGYLSIFEKTGKVMRVVASWGRLQAVGEDFKPSSCWAIRRGHLHFVQNPEVDPICPHVKGFSGSLYLCAPMIAQGEILGMLHLQLHTEDEKPAEEVEKLYFSKQIMVTSLLEHYAPPLTNLRLRETLKIQSIHDHLTGLYNRRYMIDTLEFEARRAKRHNTTLGIIMVDVDHFKSFNDTFGHEVGDIVLRELGSFLRNNIRQEDIACRYGGEEFILILPSTSFENSRMRAEALREKIEKKLMINHLKKIHTITVSLGVAVFPLHGETIEETLNAADSALYLAKTNGRNRVEVGNGNHREMQITSA
ncbi:MAG: diguanylate cyclase [Pseudomonadota bacterium]